MSERIVARGGRLRTSCENILEGIPAIERIDMEWSPNAAMGPVASVSFKGWSPSLHSTWIQAICRIPDGVDDEDRLADILLDGFRPAFRRQARRAADAALLGHALPLPNGITEHLLIDEAMVALAGETGMDLAQAIRIGIGGLHGSSRLHRGGTRQRMPGMQIGEAEGDGAVLRYAAPDVRITVRGRYKAAMHRGDRIDARSGPLPETALTAAIGRTVGDVAYVHPILNGRRIVRAENGFDGMERIVSLHIEPRFVSIGSVR